MADANSTGPVTLGADQLKEIHNTLDEMNLGLVAMYNLARDSLDNPRAESLLLGIESIAKVSCRKADRIAALLGTPVFGNFEDEFNIPEKEASHHG